MPLRFKITGLKAQDIDDLKQALTLMNGGLQTDVAGGAFLTKDPNLVLDTAAGEFNCYYTYRDWASKWKGNWSGTFGKFINREINQQSGVAESTEDALIRMWGLPVVRGEGEQFVKDARDHYRNHNFQPTPAPNLALAATPDAALATTLNGPGACLNRKHGDGASVDLLLNAIASGTIPSNGGALIGIEEFNITLQADLDEYFAMPANTPLPQSLRAALQDLDQKQEAFANAGGLPPFGNRFSQLVQSAQAARVPLVAMDSGEASPAGIQSSDPAYFERRAVQMNLVAERAINDAKVRYNIPNAKVIAACGAAHGNTHPGGIPGLSQIFDIAAVKLAPGGQLVLDPEDTTNRTMPSPVEQAFIEAFVTQAKKSHTTYDKSNPNESFDYKSLMTGAQRLAAKLTAAGKLPNLGPNAAGLDANQVRNAVTAAMSFPETKAAVAGEVMKASQTKRTADLKWPSADNLLKVLNETPELAALAFPGKDAAAVAAAQQGQFGAVGNLLTGGADPTTAGATWQEFTFTVARTRNDGQKGEQAAALDTLLANMNVQVDAQDAQGRTVGHLAAWNGNEKALDAILLKAGDLTLTDNRGWTPRQVAMASDKPAAEQFFSQNHIEPPADLLPQQNATFDTVQMLTDATLCEDPNHRNKMKAMYKELYANPTLRPILNIIAVDAARPRDAASGQGLRLVAANHSNVSNLFHAVKEDTTLQGAYADENHVMMVSCSDVGDSSGTLIHELTHAAARLMYGQETIPAPKSTVNNPSTKMDDYKDAIAADVRNLHLLDPVDDYEVRVKERIAGRMAEYAEKAPKQGKHPDTKLLQEFLVSVPQLIAEFGEDTVQRFAPNLLGYFKDFGQQIQGALQNDVRFSGVAAQLDNTTLDATVGQPTKRTAAVDRRTPAGNTFTLDEVKAKLEAEVRLRKGQFKSENAKGATFAYGADNYTLDDAEQQMLDNAKKALGSVWAKASDGAAPPTLSFEDTKGLISRLADNVDKPAKEMKGTLQKSIGAWSRDAKVGYVQHQIKHNKDVTEEQLAEAIVLMAENRVFEAYDVTTGEEAPEVDPAKHTKLVAELSGQLNEVFKTRKPDLRELVTELSDSVAGGKAAGVFKKEKEKTRGSAHVSINVKNARMTWLRKLATL